MMKNRVFSFVNSHNLLDKSKLYLVALSGGADSVALLLWMHEAGYHVEAAHCNFHLRGAESDRDEAFCDSLCLRLRIELHRAHFDTRTYATLHQVSIEMAARELRYRWFEQLRHDLGAEGICVAHHRDDSVETVLLNLLRGTGLRGLTGIQPRNGHILRPLLCVSRADIEGYLAQHGQPYVTDSSNLEADVQRNKVRLRLLPLLRELNPAADDVIARTASNLASAQALLDDVMDKYRDSKELLLNDFKDAASSEYAAFEWLRNYGFNRSQVLQLLQAETGALCSSPQGYDALKDRGRLLVEPAPQPMKPLQIPEEGTYVLPDGAGECGQPVRLRVSRADAYVSRDTAVATLDADKLTFPLTVRRVAQGDWMIPFGMRGRRLLSDLMTDRRMTLFEKRRQLVVTDAHGAVAWLVAIRTDARFCVDKTSRQVVILSLS